MSTTYIQKKKTGRISKTNILKESSSYKLHTQIFKKIRNSVTALNTM